MKQRLIGTLFAICLFFTACGNLEQEYQGASTVVPVAAPPPNLGATNWGQPIHQDVARGANDFAFRLSAALLADMGDENFIASPFSVWMPLAALANVTNETHRPALLEAIGAKGSEADAVNQAAARMLFDLTNQAARRHNPDWPNPLHIANGMFASQRVTINQAFAQIFADYYQGGIMNVDFLHYHAAYAINRWAYDNTYGLIYQMVSPKDFDERTAAVIANAIYFSDSWWRKFDPALTQRGNFYGMHLINQAYLMEMAWQEHDPVLYFEDDVTQALTLNFETGGGITIMLPKNGDATGLLASMTLEYFEHMLARENKQLAQGRLVLPRFSMENNHNNLPYVLTNMGIPLFDEFAAPLSGENGLLAVGPPRVWLSDAMQTALIELDEEGATAAAVTLMIAVAESAPPPAQTTFEMICNRPFAFILHKNTIDGGNQILFTGVVNQP